MQKSTTLKFFTLLFFVGLISAFLLYKAGYFNSYLVQNTIAYQGSSNGGSFIDNVIDTVPQQSDSMRISIPKDSIAPETKPPPFMGGTKFALPITPREVSNIKVFKGEKAKSKASKKVKKKS